MGNSLTFLWMLVQTVLALAFVCGIAYLIFRVILPRFAITHGGNSMIRIVDRLGLEARKTLYVIEVGGKYMLVAASEEGVQMISELDAEMAKELETSRMARNETSRLDMNGRSFSQKLEELMGRKSGGGK
jgi:flagellar protein FliO/FliZ